jgi:hypothetical protein
VQPEIKGFENPDKNHTNPLQNKKIPPQNQGAQSKSGFVPFDLNKR